MKKDHAPYDSDFEANWNSLDETRKNKTMVVVLIAGSILIGLILYLFSQRHHDAFVEPKIKLQLQQQQ